jgi:hypothetical protein
MARENPDTFSDWSQRQRALSRWDNEGGAGPEGPPWIRRGPIPIQLQSPI